MGSAVLFAAFKRGHHSTHITKELQNPFAGILYCAKCGAILKRNAALSGEIKGLQEAEADLMLKKEVGTEVHKAALYIIPATQHILDNYDILTTEEKKRLFDASKR